MTNEPAPQGAGFFLATRGAGTFVTWVTSPNPSCRRGTLLLRIHRLMTEKTLDNPEDAGRFRTNDDVVVENGIDNNIYKLGFTILLQ